MPRRPPDILRKSHAHTEGKSRASDKRALERELDRSMDADEPVLLLRLDGFVRPQGEPLPGAVETITWLGQQGMAYMFVAGSDCALSSALADRLSNAGMDVSADRILTPEAAADQVARGRGIVVATIAELSSKLGDR